MPKIKTVKFCKFRNDLLKSKFINDIKTVVSEKLKEINIQQFRTNPELVLIVCQIVWNACNDLKIKDDDLDKKQLVLDILTPLLSYSPADVATVKTQIEYIVNNNQIIIVSTSTRVFKGAWNFLKKKLV
jgi:hypothetical protein